MPPARRVSFDTAPPVVVEVPRNDVEDEPPAGAAADDAFDEDAFDAEFEAEMAAARQCGGAVASSSAVNIKFDDDLLKAAPQQSKSTARVVASPPSAPPMSDANFDSAPRASPAASLPPLVSSDFANFDSAPLASSAASLPPLMSSAFANFDSAPPAAVTTAPPTSTSAQSSGSGSAITVADSEIVRRLEARMAALEEMLRQQPSEQAILKSKQKYEGLETQVSHAVGRHHRHGRHADPLSSFVSPLPPGVWVTAVPLDCHARTRLLDGCNR